MKTVYGYTRVSTAKQGTKGVSLKEQKDAIERYAKLNQLDLIEWYEERETAAKQGRKIFRKMLDQLKAGLASGVVMHKIDRSARNLRDWAELVDLADYGTEVHFANESIDMSVRGGRLSADIQAVVATDYIRNLREEAIKGLRGRLKDGIYPFRAPVGYLDTGGGNVKAVDPVKAPMIKSLFEDYATGEYSVRELRLIAHAKGLSNVDGRPISLTGITTILHNPFYTGLIHIKRTGERFAGAHEPIITKTLFDQVQANLANKKQQGKGKYDYLYRRMFTCIQCGRSLIAERHKGRVYYRCHLCAGVSLREDAIDQTINDSMQYCVLTDEEVKIVDDAKQTLLNKSQSQQTDKKKVLKLELENTESRLSSLTDKLLDEIIDKTIYLQKKNELTEKIQSIKSKLAENAKGLTEEVEHKLKYLELFKTFNLCYQTAVNTQKRRLLKLVTSNRFVQGKNIVVELHKPFYELCMIKKHACCGERRDRSRTFEKEFQKWIKKPLTEEEVDTLLEREAA